MSLNTAILGVNYLEARPHTDTCCLVSRQDSSDMLGDLTQDLGLSPRPRDWSSQPGENKDGGHDVMVLFTFVFPREKL